MDTDNRAKYFQPGNEFGDAFGIAVKFQVFSMELLSYYIPPKNKEQFDIAIQRLLECRDAALRAYRSF